MGQVRSWKFDAVIGVGGIKPWSKYKGIARKVTWIGIGAHKDKMDSENNPLVSFDHFLYYGEDGPLLKDKAPALARHMYEKGVRVLMNLSPKEQQEVDQILDWAKDAPSSSQSKSVIGKCRLRSYHDISKTRKTEQMSSVKAEKRCG